MQSMLSVSRQKYNAIHKQFESQKGFKKVLKKINNFMKI
jgi:hypothetical protein